MHWTRDGGGGRWCRRSWGKGIVRPAGVRQGCRAGAAADRDPTYPLAPVGRGRRDSAWSRWKNLVPIFDYHKILHPTAVPSMINRRGQRQGPDGAGAHPCDTAGHSAGTAAAAAVA